MYEILEWNKILIGSTNYNYPLINIDYYKDYYIIIGTFQNNIIFNEESLSSTYQTIFIMKVNYTDNKILWKKQCNVTNGDIYSNIVKIDNKENIIISGRYYGNIDFFGMNINSLEEKIFISKLNKNGVCEWFKDINSNFNYTNEFKKICILSDNSIITTGTFANELKFTDTIKVNYNDKSCIFISKINKNGDWEWAKQTYGSTNSYVYSLVNIDDESILICGSIIGIIEFDNINRGESNKSNIYVAKLNITTKVWEWITTATSDLEIIEYGPAAFDICLSTDNSAIICGNFRSKFKFKNYLESNNLDIYVSKIDKNGYWIWEQKAIGNGNYVNNNVNNNVNSIISFEDGSIAIIGSITSNTTFGNIILNNIGLYDIFIAKINKYGNWSDVINAGSVSDDYGLNFVKINNNNLLVSGICKNNSKFGNITINSFYDNNIFVAGINIIQNYNSDLLVEHIKKLLAHIKYMNKIFENIEIKKKLENSIL